MRKALLGYLFLITACLLQPLSAMAVVLGHTDSFQDLTTQGWTVGVLGAPHPAPPANVATGGPGGAGDAFLQLTSVGGSGAGNRLTTINLQPAWAGSYISAGVTAISMDVNNLGNTRLQLRLLFEDPGGGNPPNNVAFSKTAIGLQAGSGWQHIVFPIAPGDLEADQGSVLAALNGATAVRIFNSTAAGFPGEPIVASLGVDNITAVPEPKAGLMLAVLLGALTLTHAIRRARSR